MIAHDLALHRASVLDIVLPQGRLLWLDKSHNVLCSLDNVLLGVHMGFQQGFFQGFLVGLWVFLVLDQGCLRIGFVFKLVLNEGLESLIGIFDDCTSSIFGTGRGTSCYCGEYE